LRSLGAWLILLNNSAKLRACSCLSAAGVTNDAVSRWDSLETQTMQREQDRRLFLTAMSSWGLGMSALANMPLQAEESKSANEKIVIGIMGIRQGSRGSALAEAFMAAGAEVAYVCDVDKRTHAGTLAFIEQKQKKKPEAVLDVRKILDDRAVDVLVCAAPNHWHAPATIMGCKAGKHVYVEKPCSQTPEEGELAIQAAREHKRIVQMGSQRRSWPAIQEAMQKIHAGELGRALYARTWYNNARPSIKHGQTTAPPDWLDWNLWQGPATERPYKDNLVHYNWHWHWHYGNGELGNNGVHAIDVARWALQVKYPQRVTAGGGKYRHDDDQETPDTMMTTFDFAENKTITWEGLSWSPYGPGGNRFGLSVHGEKGTLVIADSGYKIYDSSNKEIAAQTGSGGELTHVQNFLDCVRNGNLPHADIAEAHQSTLLCHLGNIAFRTGSTLRTDAANGHILQNAEAEKLWSREYRAEWETRIRG
jgi:predicted dehydrogenase